MLRPTLLVKTVSASKIHRFAWGLLTTLLTQNVAPLRATETVVQPAAGTPVVWKLDNLKQIGGQAPTVEGAPKIVAGQSGGAAVQFDGKADGIVLPVNPLAGFSRFTIEILFSPAPDGETEQRFFHLQDDAGRRALVEIRLNKAGGWWLDTFLKPTANAGLTLVDSTKVHPADRWYWVALRYDGKCMSSFVNGEKELEGDLTFEPMSSGQASLGVRLNRVYWFKGAIREVRLHPAALLQEKLQRMD